MYTHQSAASGCGRRCFGHRGLEISMELAVPSEGVEVNELVVPRTQMKC